jgi:hypothetical protein
MIISTSTERATVSVPAGFRADRSPRHRAIERGATGDRVPGGGIGEAIVGSGTTERTTMVVARAPTRGPVSGIPATGIPVSGTARTAGHRTAGRWVTGRWVTGYLTRERASTTIVSTPAERAAVFLPAGRAADRTARHRADERGTSGDRTGRVTAVGTVIGGQVRTARGLPTPWFRGTAARVRAGAVPVGGVADGEPVVAAVIVGLGGRIGMR